jgi:hypothetical protein
VAAAKAEAKKKKKAALKRAAEEAAAEAAAAQEAASAARSAAAGVRLEVPPDGVDEAELNVQAATAADPAAAAAPAAAMECEAPEQSLEQLLEESARACCIDRTHTARMCDTGAAACLTRTRTRTRARVCVCGLAGRHAADEATRAEVNAEMHARMDTGVRLNPSLAVAIASRCQCPGQHIRARVALSSLPPFSIHIVASLEGGDGRRERLTCTQGSNAMVDAHGRRVE